MRILRNIFIALAYLTGIIGIIMVVATQDNWALISFVSIGFTLLALLLAGRLKRSFIKVPLIIGVLGVVLAYVVPTVFPKEVDQSEVTSLVEQEASQSEEDVLEFIEEMESDSLVTAADDNSSGDQPEIITEPGKEPTVENAVKTDENDVFEGFDVE